MKYEMKPDPALDKSCLFFMNITFFNLSVSSCHCAWSRIVAVGNKSAHMCIYVDFHNCITLSCFQVKIAFLMETHSAIKFVKPFHTNASPGIGKFNINNLINTNNFID